MNPLPTIILPAIACFAPTSQSSIRDIDITGYLISVEPNLSGCETAQTPSVVIEFKQFSDIDGDGIEEMILVGRSCYSGSGGPDILRVYKQVSPTKLLNISPSSMITFFKGKRILPEGGNWSPFLEFKNGYLIKTYSDRHGLHGEVLLYFKWCMGKFQLLKVHRIPYQS